MSGISSVLPAPLRSYEVYSDAPARSQQSAGSAVQHSGNRPAPSAAAAAGLPGAASTAIVPLQKDGATGEVRFDAIVTAQHKGQIVHSRFSDLVEKDATKVIQSRPTEAEEAEVAARTRAALGGIVSAKLTTSRPTHIADSAQNKSEEAKIIRYTPAEDTAGYNAATKQRIIKMVEAAVDPLEPPKFKHKKVPGGPPEAPVPVMHSPPRKVTLADQQAWKIPPCVSNWKNSRGYVIPLDKRIAADGRNLLEPTVNDNFAKLSEALLMAERKARVEVETRAAIQKKLAMKQKEEKEAELRDLAAKARLERTGVATSLGGSGGGSGGYGGERIDGRSGGFEGEQLDGAPRARPAMPTGPLVGYGDSDDDEDEEAEGGAGGGAGAAAAAASSGREGSDGVAADAGYSGSGGSAAAADSSARHEHESEEEHRARLEREQIRRERKRERERDLRMEAAGRKGKAARDEDRDMSERIALGIPVGPGRSGGAESMYDARLFNQSEGMASGFGAEDDYNVYSAAWRSEGGAGGLSAIYRPTRSGAGGGPLSDEAAAEAVDELRERAAKRFKVDTDFEGGPGGGAGGAVAPPRSGPVQFEKGIVEAGSGAAASKAADPFNLDAMLGGDGRGRRSTALDNVGKRGFMSSAGGAASRTAAELGLGSGRTIDFQPASGR